eukprot:g1114.t1
MFRQIDISFDVFEKTTTVESMFSKVDKQQLLPAMRKSRPQSAKVLRNRATTQKNSLLRSKSSSKSLLRPRTATGMRQSLNKKKERKKKEDNLFIKYVNRKKSARKSRLPAQKKHMSSDGILKKDIFIDFTQQKKLQPWEIKTRKKKTIEMGEQRFHSTFLKSSDYVESKEPAEKSPLLQQEKRLILVEEEKRESVRRTTLHPRPQSAPARHQIINRKHPIDIPQIDEEFPETTRYPATTSTNTTMKTSSSRQTLKSYCMKSAEELVRQMNFSPDDIVTNDIAKYFVSLNDKMNENFSREGLAVLLKTKPKPSLLLERWLDDALQEMIQQQQNLPVNLENIFQISSKTVMLNSLCFTEILREVHQHDKDRARVLGRVWKDVLRIFSRLIQQSHKEISNLRLEQKIQLQNMEELADLKQNYQKLQEESLKDKQRLKDVEEYLERYDKEKEIELILNERIKYYQNRCDQLTLENENLVLMVEELGRRSPELVRRLTIERAPSLASLFGPGSPEKSEDAHTPSLFHQKEIGTQTDSGSIMKNQLSQTSVDKKTMDEAMKNFEEYQKRKKNEILAGMVKGVVKKGKERGPGKTWLPPRLYNLIDTRKLPKESKVRVLTKRMLLKQVHQIITELAQSEGYENQDFNSYSHAQAMRGSRPMLKVGGGKRGSVSVKAGRRASIKGSLSGSQKNHNASGENSAMSSGRNRITELTHCSITLEESCLDYYNQKYGIKGLAESHFYELITNVRRYLKEKHSLTNDELLQLVAFACFCGGLGVKYLEGINFSTTELSAYLFLYACIHAKNDKHNQKHKTRRNIVKKYQTHLLESLNHIELVASASPSSRRSSQHSNSSKKKKIKSDQLALLTTARAQQLILTLIHLVDRTEGGSVRLSKGLSSVVDRCTLSIVQSDRHMNEGVSSEMLMLYVVRELRNIRAGINTAWKSVFKIYASMDEKVQQDTIDLVTFTRLSRDVRRGVPKKYVSQAFKDAIKDGSNSLHSESFVTAILQLFPDMDQQIIEKIKKSISSSSKIKNENAVSSAFQQLKESWHEDEPFIMAQLRVHDDLVGVEDKSNFQGKLKRFEQLLDAKEDVAETKKVLLELRQSLWNWVNTMDEETVAKINNFAQFNEVVRYVPMLNKLNRDERDKIAIAMCSCTFESGEEIIHQGDIGDAFFILIEGTCSVTILPEEVLNEKQKLRRQVRYQEEKGDDSELLKMQKKLKEYDEDADEVKNLAPGDFFGELALLKDAPRAATVTAVQRVKCVSLTRAAFNELLGPLQHLLNAR